MALYNRLNANVLLVGLDPTSRRKYCLKIAAAWVSGVQFPDHKERKISCTQSPVILALFFSGLDIIHSQSHTCLLDLRLKRYGLTPIQSGALRPVQCLNCQGVRDGFPLASPFLLSPPYLPFSSRLHSPALETQFDPLCRDWRSLGTSTGSWDPKNCEWAVAWWVWGGRLMETNVGLADAGTGASKMGLCPVSGLCRPEPSCGTVYPQSCWPSKWGAHQWHITLTAFLILVGHPWPIPQILSGKCVPVAQHLPGAGD